MIVFISWSGELSRRLGEILRTWLPGSLQYVKPYFTPEDIEKGARWNSEIAQQLSKSTIGILCLTPENLQSPWLMFEAGALSKEMERSRICPILFELDNADLMGPLVQFQTTTFNRDDMLKLVQTVNHFSGDNQLNSDVLLSVFDTWWPKLESQVQAVLNDYKKSSMSRKGGSSEIRQDREVLEEVLNLVRLISTQIKSEDETTPTERLSTQHDKVERIIERIIERPKHRVLPASRQSITHQFSLAGHEGYVTVGLYEDGQPGELFLTMAKEGSTVGGLMDTLGRCVSIALQYGVPLITLVDMFRHARFEPSGMTSNKDIPFAKSLVDYIFCWLGCQFVPGYADRNLPNRSAATSGPGSGPATPRALIETTKQLAQKIAEARKHSTKDEAPVTSKVQSTTSGTGSDLADSDKPPGSTTAETEASKAETSRKRTKLRKKPAGSKD